MWSVVYCAFVIAVVHGLDNPIVETNYGKIRGKWLWSRGNLPIASFIGIPYAEPPIGDLRFKSPRPWKANWTEIRNATEDGLSCIQLDNHVPVGDEDCLFLNVYVPEFPNKTNLPIMAYVHGGSFHSLNSSSNIYSPAYLGDHEVILVTMNYRLGIFGFMSTGTESVPGNNGIKDVREALRWIQKNIRNFNGDPNTVTLVGHSAGGIIVHHLALSQSTEGLFDKYITLSGTAFSSYSAHSAYIMRYLYLKIAAAVECTSVDKVDEYDRYSTEEHTDLEEDVAYTKAVEDDVIILNCFKDVNSAKIALTAELFHIWREYPNFNFVPSIEVGSADPVIVKPPLLTIKNREYRDIPWITGLVQDEGLMRSAYMFHSTEAEIDLFENFDNVSSYYMEANHFVSNSTAFSRMLLDYYFHDGPNVTEIVDHSVDFNLTQMIGDGLITWPTYRTLNMQSEGMKSNVYFYYFAYIGTFSLTFDYEVLGNHVFGVCHGDELNFIFPFGTYLYRNLQLHNTESDWTMVNIMTELFTSFAKNGVPSARLSPVWEPYQKNHKFMCIGDEKSTEIYMDGNFLPERMNFWENVILNLSMPIHEYFINDYEDTTEYEKDTESSIAIASQIRSLCTPAYLLLLLIPAILS